MSRQQINAYRTRLAKLHAVSGSLNEGVVSAAFGGLLEKWGRSLDLTLVGLLARVVTVSVRTVAITDAMKRRTAP